MLGCAFAIRRDYFFDLGAYDEQLMIWNGENYEVGKFKLYFDLIQLGFVILVKLQALALRWQTSRGSLFENFTHFQKAQRVA